MSCVWKTSENGVKMITSVMYRRWCAYHIYKEYSLLIIEKQTEKNAFQKEFLVNFNNQYFIFYLLWTFQLEAKGMFLWIWKANHTNN